MILDSRLRPAQENIIISFIILAGVVFSLFLGVATGAMFRTEFSGYHDDAEVYNQMALALAERGTFLDEHGNYYGWGRRAPGYPLLLAAAYSVWPSPVAAWILNEILFVVSIIIMWRIARFFLARGWQFLPPLLFALAWFTTPFVIRVGSDVAGLFWSMAGVWLLLVYLHATRPIRWLAGAGVAFGMAALTRPAILYVLVLIAIWVYWREHSRQLTMVAGRVAMFLGAGVLIVTPAILWSYQTFGTPQLASAGYILAWRSRDALWSLPRAGTSAVAALLGDLVADLISPGYASYPDPYPQKDEVIQRRLEMQQRGISEKEIDEFFYREALGNIAAHPFMFLATGVINIPRLLTPPNYNGISMTHFLAEQSGIPVGLRILANICIRLMWFGFLAASVAACVGRVRENAGRWSVDMVLLSGFVLYVVGMQAFIADAEFRYILPAIPIAILFFSLYIQALYESFVS